MALPVAIQLYSIRDEAEKDLKAVLAEVKSMGYDGVEFAGLYGHSAEDVASMIRDAGLVPISAHVALDELLADTQAVINAYKTIGCRYIAVPYLPGDRRPESGAFESTLEDIRNIGRQCADAGIQLLYHNHDFEFVKIGDEYALDVLYARIPAQYLKTQIDTCWVNVAGVNPADYVLKYTGRAPVVHLKDFVMQGKSKPSKLYELIGIEEDSSIEENQEEFGFRPVGHGVQDMPAILDACISAGAEWVVVEQDRPGPGQTPLASAAMSREYLKTLGW